MVGGSFRSRFPGHERQSSIYRSSSRQFIWIPVVNLVSLDYFADYVSGVFAVKLAKHTVKLAKRRKCMMGFDVTISATIFNLLVWIGIVTIANGWVWDTFHSGCHSIDASLSALLTNPPGLSCRGPCL